MSPDARAGCGGVSYRGMGERGRAASRTAGLVRQGRAAADGRAADGRFADPVAARLLRVAERASVDQVRAGTPPHGRRERTVYESVRACAEVVVPRTVAIDEALRARPTGQLVILGAGLDSRAWRLAELARTDGRSTIPPPSRTSAPVSRRPPPYHGRRTRATGAAVGCPSSPEPYGSRRSIPPSMISGPRWRPPGMPRPRRRHGCGRASTTSSTSPAPSAVPHVRAGIPAVGARGRRGERLRRETASTIGSRRTGEACRAWSRSGAGPRPAVWCARPPSTVPCPISRCRPRTR